MTVGAVNAGGNYASFSSRGPTVDGRVKPDVMAQGQSAAVLTTTGAVDFSSGTSFSSPILAGAVACLWQSRPETKNFELMQIIRESAHLYQNPTPQMGYGIPNFEIAYNVLLGLGSEDLAQQSLIAIAPNPVKTYFEVSLPASVEQAEVLIYNTIGQLIYRTQVSHSQEQVSMEGWSKGLYIVSVKASGAENNFKIQKQ